MDAEFKDDTTIAEARRIVDVLKRGHGTRCPVCTRHVKIDRRSLNEQMAHCLQALYEFWKQHGEEYVKTTEYFTQLKIGKFNDEALMRHWMLIYPRKDEQGKWMSAKGTRGWWRIGRIGRMFVEGKCKMPVAIFHFNGELVEYDTSRLITFEEALRTPVNAQKNLKATLEDAIQTTTST